MRAMQNETNLPPDIRLSSLSHGGGCGCKMSPAVLQGIMASMPAGVLPPQLLVGTESSDDAAVYQINATQALVATTDFFTPIVDDPFDFGCIAATNALSDIYAMGAQPLLALAVVGMPLDKLPQQQIARILQGGASVCTEAGIPLAGGHSIDVAEPIYGLVAVGLVDPRHLKKHYINRPSEKFQTAFVHPFYLYTSKPAQQSTAQHSTANFSFPALIRHAKPHRLPISIFIPFKY